MRLESLNLSLLPDTLAVCRLPEGAEIPPWASQGPFFNVSRAPGELSVVCLEEFVPSGVVSQNGWRALKVQGPLDFALTGVLSSLLGPLAEAKISIFALSTFETDYILVKAEKLSQAVQVLVDQGHRFSEASLAAIKGRITS